VELYLCSPYTPGSHEQGKLDVYYNILVVDMILQQSHKITADRVFRNLSVNWTKTFAALPLYAPQSADAAYDPLSLACNIT